MFIPNPNFPIPDPDPHQEFTRYWYVFLTQKTVSKLSEKISGMFIPVFSIPDTLVKRAPDPGSATLIFDKDFDWIVNKTVIKINSTYGS
jgi:hypothetical protein